MGVFDSSDDESDGGFQANVHGKEAATSLNNSRWNAVTTRVRLFIDHKSPEMISDLRNEVGEEVLAKTFELANANFSKHAFEEAITQCTQCCEAAWAKLLENGRWPHRAWNELFVLSRMLLAASSLLLGNFIESVQSADYAFIMGAPKEETNLFFRLVDDEARRQRNAAAPVPSLGRMLPGREDRQKWTLEPEAMRGFVKEFSPAAKLTPVARLAGDSLPQVKTACAGNTAVIFENLVSTWPALEKWRNLDFLAEYSHRVVPVEVGGSLKHMNEKAMDLGKFLRDWLVPACEPAVPGHDVAYLAQHNLFDQLPDLRRDFSCPTICSHDGNSLVTSSVWLGTDKTVTLLHFDSYDNLLVQVAGFKYVVLFPVDQNDKLYLQNGDEALGLLSQGNTSKVNISEPDLASMPAYADAQGTCTILGPGDTLFIPQGMWHYVRSLTPSLSVNFWFQTASDDE